MSLSEVCMKMNKELKKDLAQKGIGDIIIEL